jgi:hypothetical protein
LQLRAQEASDVAMARLARDHLVLVEAQLRFNHEAAARKEKSHRRLGSGD